MPFTCLFPRTSRSNWGALLSPALLALVIQPPLLSQTARPDFSDPGAKGAQMYCFMRSSGNSHEVSWNAAYGLVKRQSASLFKTSPQHASVMISEAVVKNPDAFSDCGRYLGALFGSESPTAATGTTEPSARGPVPIPSRGTTRDDRYRY